MKTTRHYSLLDKLCLNVDQVIRVLTNNPKSTGAHYPAQKLSEPELSDAERKHAAGLMRINHAGEICAQALYHGQALVSKEQFIQAKMQTAAVEEGDHLRWCKKRLDELGSHTSYLNPFWYAGSFCIGMIAGMIGDKWSLGFVAETEYQVIKHLDAHLQKLPKQDIKSYQILLQMEKEENKHRQEALASGARELPDFIKAMMSFTSKIMVKTSYWV